MKNNITVMLMTLFVSCAIYAQDKRDVKVIKFDTAEKHQLQNAEQILKERLKLTPNDDLVRTKTSNDQLGFTHETYQQYFNGVKVEFGIYKAHAKNGNIQTMNGELFSVGKVNTSPSLSNQAAFQKVVAYVGAETYLWESPEEAKIMDDYQKPSGELVILPKEVFKGNEPRLAYKFDIYATKPVSRAYIYVDAHTGKVLYKNNIIKHANDEFHTKALKRAKIETTSETSNLEDDVYATGTAATRYSGSQSIETSLSGSSYRLRETTRGSGIETYNMEMGINYNSAIDFTDNDNNWTSAEFNNADKDNAALDAHWAAEKTYDYFYQTFNRNSYNDNGAKIKSYVHFDLVEYGYNNQDNAFWNGSVMTYGDGTSLQPLTSIDIAAHEIGHAVCTYTADLVYSYESGAMNEGMSDIWAACVEYFAAPNKQTWVLAEDVGGPIRSFSNPNAYGQPDTYQGNSWYSGSQDSGGVHTNSGVMNFWFYVLSVGKNGTNDNGDSYNVSGIGIEDAADIAYRMESVYLSSNSQYADARTGAIQAAIDLFGSGSAEEIATTNAWYAVGVGDEYVQTCSLPAPSGLAASNVGDNGFTVSWNSVSGASNYTVTVGASSTTVSGTSYTASSLTEGTTYAVSVTANCGSGGSGSTSNINVTTTGTTPISYCDSASTNVNDEFIGRVQLESINNNSGAQFYSDFTSISTDLSKGDSFTITVTPTWTGTVYNEGYAVWIDYNHDGDFSDSGEQVWSKTASKTTPVSGSFTVPSSATSGSTRMRVSMKYNGVPTACETFTYGEVEDYTVNITTATADTQAPSAPTSLTASGTTQTATSLSWNASSDNVGVTGYDVYQNGSLAKSISATSTTMSGLSAATTYTFYVRAKDAAGNTSGNSNTVSVTTQSNNVSYCNSQGNNSSYEWIDLVQLNNLSNATGNNGGYEDFTNLTANVPYGSNTVYISAGFSSSAYNEYWKVWIDYDQDGTFETGELIASGSSSSSGTLSATFTVPTSATAGTTRMRVSMKWNAAQTACESFSYGEVEDYSVNIGQSNAAFNAVVTNATEIGNEASVYGVSIYPNPVKGSNLNVSVLDSRNLSYSVYNLLGKKVLSGSLQTQVIDVNVLPSGLYVVKFNDGQKDIIKKFIKQ